MNDETTLLPCPFCGSNKAYPNIELGKHWVECRECTAESGCYRTEAEAIAAWNSRADYHGYEQAAIEAWENIKAWNTRAELGSGTCHMSFIDEYETASGDEEYLCECSECGYRRWEPACDLPLFCSKCGRKVKR